ncbi:hypothetical protein L596_010239 [Steinernema carpocapsae]|uniref:Uncharacterized protein n=1 Tax=Steinernema carpocapsae TaxID=34508 RepID=A0A4U5PI78_STECR|nr:hypothetical protein L596_010239 [Steinernema carpocapsae]
MPSSGRKNPDLVPANAFHSSFPIGFHHRLTCLHSIIYCKSNIENLVGGCREGGRSALPVHFPPLLLPLNESNTFSEI